MAGPAQQGVVRAAAGRFLAAGAPPHPPDHTELGPRLSEFTQALRAGGAGGAGPGPRAGGGGRLRGARGSLDLEEGGRRQAASSFWLSWRPSRAGGGGQRERPEPAARARAARRDGKQEAGGPRFHQEGAPGGQRLCPAGEGLTAAPGPQQRPSCLSPRTRATWSSVPPHWCPRAQPRRNGRPQSTPEHPALQRVPSPWKQCPRPQTQGTTLAVPTASRNCVLSIHLSPQTLSPNGRGGPAQTPSAAPWPCFPVCRIQIHKEAC